MYWHGGRYVIPHAWEVNNTQTLRCLKRVYCWFSWIGIVFAVLWPVVQQGHSSTPKPAPTVEEVRMWRGSQYWLAGAAAAVGAYVLLGGQYFTISTIEEDPDVDDEDDDVVLQE
jgi:hypothetical protein